MQRGYQGRPDGFLPWKDRRVTGTLETFKKEEGFDGDMLPTFIFILACVGPCAFK